VIQLVTPGGTTNYTYGNDGRIRTIQRGPQTWAFMQGPFCEIVRIILPTAQQQWFVSDYGAGRLLRRCELPAPGVAPVVESAFGVPREHSNAPVAELWGPVNPPSLRATLTGVGGATSQVANHLGQVVADRAYDHFGNQVAQIGAQQPLQGYAGMVAIKNLNGLHLESSAFFYHPDDLGSVIKVTDPRRGHAGAGAVYLPEAATFQNADGLGTDGFQPGSNVEHPLWYVNLGIKLLRYRRSKIIEEGGYPPPIPWPPYGPRSSFGPSADPNADPVPAEADVPLPFGGGSFPGLGEGPGPVPFIWPPLPPFAETLDSPDRYFGNKPNPAPQPFLSPLPPAADPYTSEGPF
ncbi:MAG TPA: hypothetical protein VEY91_08580, partial [Candidatus Limnocylindria bacterium]|nr:hypothetical protein [Candidatus Limnocylindria bacterium]